MSSVRSRVDALERRPGGWQTNSLLAGFPTDPEERAELLKRIHAEREARLKGGGRGRISIETGGGASEPKTLCAVAKERAELLQRIREERARRAQAFAMSTSS